MTPTLLTLLLTQARTPIEAPATVAARLARECAKAFETKDKGWFERRLAPRFAYTDLKGERLERAEMLDRLDRWFHPLGYRVGASLVLVSSGKAPSGMRLVSDLKVRSQLFGFRRMPLTETTMRVASFWRPKGKEWLVERIVELSTRKTVDGKPVED